MRGITCVAEAKKHFLGNALTTDLKRLTRAFGLLWGRLGSARIYLAVVAAVIITLAALGAWHLVSPREQAEPTTASYPAVKATQPPTTVAVRGTPRPPSTVAPNDKAVAHTSPSAQPISPAPAASLAPTLTSDLGREVAITEVTQTEKRGRHRETFVVATIGMASRSNLEKGGVEIHVYFYDLTPNNEMRPTNAQVTYQWLTPVRDWSDPTPKYLAATYLKRATRHRSLEKLRYGGFVVRVYSSGKLQDERSEPQELLSLLRSSGPQDPSPTVTRMISPAPVALASPAPQKNIAATKITPLPNASPRPAEKKTSQDSSLPYGKPVPRKPGFVSSPFDPKFIIDVRGFPPGTLVNDPNTNKPFRVP